LIFFLPSGSGPFSVVHGPATALRGKRAADLVLLSIGLVLAKHFASMPPAIGLTGADTSPILTVVAASDDSFAIRC
jgi:hypothetical protein